MTIKFTKIIMCTVAVSALFGMRHAAAQEFKWGFRFDTNFDNREFGPIESQNIKSKTYFSVRLAPVVGIGWDGGHSVMAGGTFTYDMGASFGRRDPELLLYYNFKAPKYGVYAGKFERRRLIGAYSRAIYAGSSSFYDNVIDGFALQYTPGESYLELVLDWDGMQSPTVRESFRIMSAGEFNPVQHHKVRWLTMGYSLDMYHLASSANAAEGVVEHLSVEPWVGAAFDRLGDIWLDKLSLKAGWLGSFDRDRSGDNKWMPASGVVVDFNIEKKRVGIRNRLYMGDKQFTFYNSYGNRIYKGDPFFGATGTYNFTQIYWRPHLAKGVDLNLEFGLHYDGHNMGTQQVALIGVTLDNGMFKKRHKDRKREN